MIESHKILLKGPKYKGMRGSAGVRRTIKKHQAQSKTCTTKRKQSWTCALNFQWLPMTLVAQLSDSKGFCHERACLFMLTLGRLGL